VRYVRDDSTHGFVEFQEHGQITLLSNPEHLANIRGDVMVQSQQGTLKAFPPSRRPLEGLFARDTPESTLLRQALSRELAHEWQSYRVFFDVYTNDRAAFDQLVSKLTELDGFVIHIQSRSSGTYQVTVSASDARMKQLKRSL
jgi:hypothetical protein